MSRSSGLHIDDERALGESTVGETIGRFIVLGRLGRGGMGTVYEAFDRTLDRRVAVKVLHRDVAPRHQERLILEAKALAQLSHPNVVQVYEVGEADGRHFVAMELVQGETLRQWIKQEPTPDWRACVEIYLAAGAGLAAAHEQGLVHCDFKPANAIVDDRGRVRVLDFGLARPIDDYDHDYDYEMERSPSPGSRISAADIRLTRRSSRSSNSGSVMGTPAYMPPEQMRGQEVDARGDQFSFCVSLFEAVYGMRPFEGRTLAQLREAREAEDIVATPRNTKAPGALRELLVRGLAADPERRWSSMFVLLDRLRRLVTPHRRRYLLVTSGVLAVGLGVAGVGLAYQAEVGQRCSGAETQLGGIWDDDRRLQVERAILGTELSYAADTWDRVSASLDDYATGWVDKHTEVCEATSVRREQSAAVMDLRMGCLDDRRVALREVVNVLTQSETSRVAQAVTLVGSLPDLARCDDIDALGQALPLPDDPDEVRRINGIRDDLAKVRALRSGGSYEEALTEAEALAVMADELAYEPLRAETLFERGLARQEQAQYAPAEQDLEQAYLLAAQLGHVGVVAAAVRELAFVVGHDQARHGDGLLWGKTALALSRGMHAAPEEEASALSIIGVILLEKGELDESFEHQQQALELYEQALGPRHADVADPQHNLGNLLWKQGKLEQALVHLRESLAIREDTLGSGHPQVAIPLTTIGAVLAAQGKHEQALDHVRRALSIREAALGPKHPDVAQAINNLAITYMRQGKAQQARENFERALTIQQEVLGPNHPRVAYPLNNIGELLRTQKKPKEALEYFQRAQKVLETSLGPKHPNVAASLVNLGNVLHEQERFEEAGQHYQRAFDIHQATLPEDHPLLAWSLLGLAKVELAQERFAEARDHAQRAVAIREGADVPAGLVSEARFLLARALGHDAKQREQARTLAQEAREGWANAGPDDELAKEYLDRVDEWLDKHPPR